RSKGLCGAGSPLARSTLNFKSLANHRSLIVESIGFPLIASCSDTLEPLLRIYEGCGRAYLGEVEGANIIKIHRRSGKLSYLVYAEFDDDPHPALHRSVRVDLRNRQIESSGDTPVGGDVDPDHAAREADQDRGEGGAPRPGR